MSTRPFLQDLIHNGAVCTIDTRKLIIARELFLERKEACSVRRQKILQDKQFLEILNREPLK